MDHVDKIKARLKAATKGPWEWWTRCSYRRLSAEGDGDVLRGYVCVDGVVDIVAEDEAHATALARQLLAYFQGPLQRWTAAPQETLRDMVP